jgi:hypothetical protein
MNTTCDFLDAIKARHGVPSDYALAKTLGVTHQMVSGYRAGRVFLGDSTAIKVAELLELDAAVILAAVHCERAKKPDEKAAWSAMLEKLGGIAAALFISIGGASAPAPAQAAPTSQSAGTICIM